MSDVQTIYHRPDTPKGLYEGPVEWAIPSTGNINILASKLLNVSSNGVYTITPGANYDAMYNAVVNVQVAAPNVQEVKEVEVYSNGNWAVKPDIGYTSMSAVNVFVNVPAPALEVKEVEYTANGNYTVTPDKGYTSMSAVNVFVNVPAPALEVNNTIVINAATLAAGGTIVIEPTGDNVGLSSVTITLDNVT